MTPEEKYEGLLMQLVSMFHFAALQHMGKLKNPLTDKIERDLPQAQATIDMLEMLHTKMKGNLNPDEEKLLSRILQEVKLNYVDEVGKSPSPETPPSAGETTAQ